MRTARFVHIKQFFIAGDHRSQREINRRPRLKIFFLIHALAAMGVAYQLSLGGTSIPAITWTAYFLASCLVAGVFWWWHLKLKDNGEARAHWPSSVSAFVISTAWAMLTVFVPDDPHSHLVLGSILIVLAAATVCISPQNAAMVVACLFCIFIPILFILVSGIGTVRVTLILYLGTLAYVLFTARPWWTLNGAVQKEDTLNRTRPDPDLERELLRHATALDKAEKALCIAEQACVDKTRFLTAASHDLRQPMHAITLFVAALKSEVADGRARYLLDRLDRSLAGLDDLFNRLLDIGRLDAGIVTPSIKTFDAATMLDTLESRFSSLAASKSLEFRIRAKPGLRIESDPALLTELISNLLSNAFRYTEHGGVLLGIRQTGDKLRIQVTDTGCGIPEYHFERIFEEFVQLNNPSRDRRKGSGLGLAIVKRLAQVLEHPIRVRSRVGHGSSFELLVPAGGNSNECFDSAYSNIDSYAIRGALVLVVDDEIDILAAMEAVLMSWGCHCIAARSPQEAVRYIENSPRFPDVIISDHRLANHHTCFDVATTVTSVVPYEVPMIVISGECSLNLRKEIAEMGFHYLSKPVNATQLHEAIAHALDKSQIQLSKAA
jgi:signal transduction histidine kinase/CheY-like chemotaxis protein